MRGTSKRAVVLFAIPVLLSPLAACSKSDTAGTTNTSAAAGAGSSTTAAGGGGASTTAAAGGGASGGSTVKAQLPQFDPQKLTVKNGTTVTFTSTDNKPHEPTAGTKEKPEDSVFAVTVAAGGVGATPALKTGSIKYFCALHPSMTGEITVT